MRMRRERIPPPGKGPPFMSRGMDYHGGRPRTPPDGPPSNWGEPLHRRGYHHHEGRPPWHEDYGEREMLRRRGSSEEVSRSATPAADYQTSSSESSEEVQVFRSKSGRSSRQESRRKERERRKEEVCMCVCVCSNDCVLSLVQSSRNSRSRDQITQSLSRKEKLLQELHAINKVIEKKKTKKRSR